MVVFNITETCWGLCSGESCTNESKGSSVVEWSVKHVHMPPLQSAIVHCKDQIYNRGLYKQYSRAVQYCIPNTNVGYDGPRPYGRGCVRGIILDTRRALRPLSVSARRVILFPLTSRPER